MGGLSNPRCGVTCETVRGTWDTAGDQRVESSSVSFPDADTDYSSVTRPGWTGRCVSDTGPGNNSTGAGSTYHTPSLRSFTHVEGVRTETIGLE